MVYIADAGLENDQSWYEQLANAVTKGGSSAVTSGIAGMYNTGVSLYNTLGGDAEELDSIEFTEDLLGQDVANYYAQNQGAIDAVGFMLTSIIPGTAAMKAVRAGQKIVGAAKPATMLGQGLRQLSMPNTQVNQLYKAIRKGNNSLSQMSGVRLQLYGQGMRQAAIESLAFETAAVLVNNQNTFVNPDDLDYFDAVAANADSIAFGTALGGVTGGLISGITDYKKLRIAQAKTDKEFYEAGGIVNRTVEEAAPGDNLAVQIADIKFDPEGRIPKGAVFQEQMAAAETIKKDQVKKTILDMTPQPLTKSRVKGDSTLSQVADDFQKIVLDPKIEPDEVAKALGGLREIDYAGKPTKYTKTAGFELDEGLDKISSQVPETIMDKAWNSLQVPNKEGITSNRGKMKVMYDLAREDKLGDEGWKAVFSHGSDTMISSLMYTTDSGKVFAKEILSVIMNELPGINKNLNKVNFKTSNYELGKLAKSGFDPEKPGQYLGLAVKALEKMDAKRAKKLAPNFSRVIEENSVLRSKYVNNDIYMNLRTREFSALPTSIRAADMGPLEVKGERLFYGTQGERSVNINRVSFKAILDDPDKKVADITAAWAGTQSKNFKLATAIKNVEDDNLPVLTKLLNEWEIGKFMPEGKKPITLASGKTISDPEMLRAHLLTQKQNILSKLLETKRYSTEELADILDVKRSFVVRMGVPDSKGYESVFRNSNYFKTENIRMSYDAADFDRTLQVGRGMADVERKLSGLREQRNLFAAKYFGDFGKELPLSASQYKENFNAAAGITSASSTQTLLKATQAEDFNEMVFQGIGKFTNVMRTKRTEDIGRAVGGAAQSVKANPKAVAEVATVNSKLAQGEYGVMSGQQLKAISDFLPEGAIQGGMVDEAGQYLMPSRLIRDLNLGNLEQNVADYFNWNGSELKGFKFQTKEAAQFFKGIADQNFNFVKDRNQFKVLVGEQGGWNEFTLPALPLDLSRAPEVATVEFIGQRKFGTGKGIIAARNSQELQEKIRVLKSRRSDVKVTPVARTENRARLLGDFDNDLALSESTSNPDLRKLGVAWDVLPEADPRLVDDFMANATKRYFNLDRQVIRAKYHEEFKLLELADEAINPTRKAAYNSVQSKSVTAQQKTINAALGLQNIEEYKGLRTVQEKSAEALEVMYSNMTGAISKLKGTLTGQMKGDKEKAWDNLIDVMDSYDMPGVYTGAEDYIASLSKAPRDQINRLVSQSNSIISALMLRADYTQPLVSAFSTPITLFPELNALQKMVGKEIFDAATMAKGGVKVPGTSDGFFSNYKLVGQAIKDIWGKPELMQTYKEQGLVGHTLQEIVQAVDDIGFAAGKGEVPKWKSALEKAGGLLTAPSDKMDEVTRFVAARSTEMLLDEMIKHAPSTVASKIGSLKYSIMNSVVTKTHGNYIASQRPTLFQGWAGQAVGLFQTYQFNLLQAAGRHIADNNSKALMQMMFYQSGFFGVQSLPGFQLVNDHIAREGSGEVDIYSEADALLGKDAAEFVLYGGASQLTTPIFGTGVSFFTRGDLTPRTPVLIPTSLSEVPVVAFATKVLGNFATTIDAAQGSLSMNTVWQALAHNGINRPLAGLGQVMLGEKTTMEGATIYDYDEVDNIGLHTVAKLMGTTTMDEALALNSFYRAKNYQAARQTELRELGVEVKSAMRSGTPVSPVEFMSEYAERGGDYENFNKWYQSQASSVTDPQFDEMRQNLNSPEGRYLMNVMGSD